MIKGKVIEVNSRYSILAAEDGSFHKVKNYGVMTIGQRVLATEEDLYMESKMHKSLSFKQMAVIAAMLIFVTVFSTVYVMDQFTAYASVVVDVNPRVEILINKNDEVLSAKALNDDGLNFDLSALKGLEIEKAIEQLVNQVGSQGYLKGQDAYVLITTVPLKDMSESSKKALNDKIISTINESDVLQKTNVAVTQITKTQLDLSKVEGVPAGLITFETGDDSGKTLSVQDFFKVEDNQRAFSAVGTVVQGAQVDAVTAASQSSTGTASGQSDDSTDELREDLMERLNKLKQIPNASENIKDFIVRAERYFNNGIGDLPSLTNEAKQLWKGVEVNIEDDNGEMNDDSDDDVIDDDNDDDDGMDDDGIDDDDSANDDSNDDDSNNDDSEDDDSEDDDSEDDDDSIDDEEDDDEIDD